MQGEWHNDQQHRQQRLTDLSVGPSELPHVIDVRDLRKHYRNADRAALDGLSLQVPAGGVFGLLGANGAGKTTLISILAGLLDRDSGEVSVDGLDPATRRGEVRRCIAVVPQALAFYPALSVRENLRLFAALTQGSSDERTRRAVDIAELSGHLDQRAERLSGGLKRRLNLAIGLLGDARLLFLDEPTAGVDAPSRNALVQTVRRLGGEGYTVLYTSHYLDEIERACDRIAIIDQGRLLAQGPLTELLAGGERLESLFLRLTHRALAA